MNTTEQKFYALLTSLEDKLNTLIELQKPSKTITKKSVKKPVKQKKT